MKVFGSLAAAVAAGALATPAAAGVGPGSPPLSQPVTTSGYSTSDGSTTQVTGGAAQPLFGGVKPPHGWKVSTPAASNCYVSDAITNPSASTPGSQTVFGAGGQYSTEPGQLPVGPVYVNCPVAGQAISAQAW